MECGDCGVRSSVSYCDECELLLCEVCGNVCERCHKVVCRSHIQRTSSGRNVCVSCVVANYDKRAKQSRELRERRAQRAELGRKVRKHSARKEESLSFESLSRDLGPGPSVPAPAPDLRDFHAIPVADPEQLNARVLTGSASRRSPTWISGLAMGVLAWLLCAGALRDAPFPVQQAIFNLVALLVSLGAVVLTCPGAFAKIAGPDRTRSRIAFAVGLGALLVAVGLYVMRGMNAG